MSASRPIATTLLGAALLTQSAMATTAADWYSACSSLFATPPILRNDGDSAVRAKWRECRLGAVRAYCALNLEGDAAEITKSWSVAKKHEFESTYAQLCPSAFNRGFAGPHAIAFGEAEKNGPPNWFNGLSPLNPSSTSNFEQPSRAAKPTDGSLGFKLRQDKSASKTGGVFLSFFSEFGQARPNHSTLPHRER